MTFARLSSLALSLALLPIACGSSSPSVAAASGAGGSVTPAAGGSGFGAGTGGTGPSAGGTHETSGGGTTVGGQATGGTTVGGQAAGGTSAAGTDVGGTSTGATAGSGGTTTAGVATLADVQAIFDEHCVTCHDKSKGGLPTYPALSLVEGDSKAYLVNKAALETCGGTYVVPGQPDQSYLVRKVSDPTPCEGVQMPRGFEVIKPPALTAVEIATIRSWIAAGAQ